MNVDRPCFAVMSCLDQLWPLGIQQSSVQTRHGQLKDNMHYVDGVDGHIVVVMGIKNKTRLLNTIEFNGSLVLSMASHR